MGDFITVARRVLEARQAEKVDGFLLDAWTASVLVQVDDALSPPNQQRFRAMSVEQAVSIAFQVVNRAT